MQGSYKRCFKESISEWDILIRNLEDFRYRINFQEHSEFDVGFASLYIEGVGKERGTIKEWIETFDFLERVLHKWYRVGYNWTTVNHQTGFRLDITKK